MYNLNVPIKAKDPPWFAVQMGSVADSVAANIRIIIDNTNFLARKIMPKWNSLTYLYINNIKSNLKIILYQPYKVVFKVKAYYPRKS